MNRIVSPMLLHVHDIPGLYHDNNRIAVDRIILLFVLFTIQVIMQSLLTGHLNLTPVKNNFQLFFDAVSG